MMKTFLSWAVLLVLVLAVSAAENGPRCYEGCYVVSDFQVSSGGFGSTPKSVIEQIGDKYKKCSTETITYCKKEQTCNSFGGKAGIGAEVATSETTKTGGWATLTYYYCGEKDEKIQDSSPRCTQVKDKMKGYSTNESPAAGDFYVGSITSFVCKDMKNCGDNCVDMSLHPDYEEPKDVKPSDGITAKISALLLSFLLAVLVM